MDSIWYCEKTDLFSVFCPHKLKNHQSNHEAEVYKKQDFIYLEKDPTQKVYMIAKGKVKIGYIDSQGEEVVKTILSKGDIFGEAALLFEEQRNEFAQSIASETQICKLPANKLHDLMRKNKNLSIQVYKFLGLRFKKIERRIELLLFKDAKTRLIEFLKELKDEFGYCCPETGDVIINHPYTQKDIASLIATSRPTLNILLNNLKQKRNIKFSRKKMILGSSFF